MLRSIFLALIGVIGGIVALVLSVTLGVNASSWLVFFLALTISEGGIYALYKWAWNAGRIDMNEWLSSRSQCKYKYGWDGSGMAVDGKNKQLHLASRFQGRMETKTYSFSDVREWEYNIEGRIVHQADQIQLIGHHGLTSHMQAASHNIGNALGTGMANVISGVAAQEKTGFSIKVADIDHPKWFVKFRPQKNLEMEMSRWMEIFQQHINEAV